MNYELKLHPSVRKELDRLPTVDYRRMDAALLGLRSNPRPFGVQKLKGDLHRIRVGHWRIVYAILDETRLLIILRVVRRNEQTYKFLT